MIRAAFNQGLGFVIKLQGVLQSPGAVFNDPGANKQDGLKIGVGITQTFEGVRQMNAGFIKSAFAPVAEREIALSFGSFPGISESVKKLDAASDQILGEFL